MKTITLRLSDTDHQRLSEAASKQRMPMTSYLLRLFDIHMENVAASTAAHAAPKLNRRDQAFAEYRALMDNLPTTWSEGEYQRVWSAVESMRTAGGNASHTEMPMPRAMVNWKNASQGFGGIEQYEGMTHEQLVNMLADYDMKGEEPPNAFMVAYRASKPPVAE